MVSKATLYSRISNEISQDTLNIALLGTETVLRHNAEVQKTHALMDKHIAEEKVEKLEEELDFYKKLLSKPMVEIANKNKNFAETYNKQLEGLADWMVNQMAYKELAIEFGLEKGLSLDEIKLMGGQKQVSVLLNKNNDDHVTNANDYEITKKFTEKLIQNKKKKN